MASTGASELSPALLKIATHVYRFPLPATKVLFFSKCFAGNLGAEQTSKSISSMEQAREDLANELASGTPNYAQAVAGATRYCPLIAHVLQSLEKTVIQLVYEQRQEWSGDAARRAVNDGGGAVGRAPEDDAGAATDTLATAGGFGRTTGIPVDPSCILFISQMKEDPVYLNEPLLFTWTTGLGQRPRENWISNKAVVWDKCMVLAAQALSYADTVYNMLEDSAGSKFNEAGMHLRTAAGIFERLYKVELPRWVGETAEEPRVVEAEPGICEGLVHFCLAEAQQMAIGKALAAGTTPKTLLARLCEGVRKLLEDSVSAMRKGGSSSAYGKLDSPFLVHISFQQCIFRGLAYRFVAETAWAKDEYGVGLAYMIEACKHVEERRDAVSLGLPPLTGPLRNIANDLKTLQAEFRGLRDTYSRENSSIYYEPVPELDALDPLPPAVIMMKPQPSVPPPIPTEILSFKATSGDSSGVVKDASSGGGEGGGGGADDSNKKTDEELARELHEKLNT